MLGTLASAAGFTGPRNSPSRELGDVPERVSGQLTNPTVWVMNRATWMHPTRISTHRSTGGSFQLFFCLAEI